VSAPQQGYTNYSTEKASYNLIHEILLAINNKSAVSGIFCDVQKALQIQIQILYNRVQPWISGYGRDLWVSVVYGGYTVYLICAFIYDFPMSEIL
jgi:hypothetical protein